MERTQERSGAKENVLKTPAQMDQLINSRPAYKNIQPEYLDSGMWETRLEQILN
jgi:hypothetical protein